MLIFRAWATCGIMEYYTFELICSAAENSFCLLNPNGVVVCDRNSANNIGQLSARTFWELNESLVKESGGGGAVSNALFP